MNERIEVRDRLWKLILKIKNIVIKISILKGAQGLLINEEMLITRKPTQKYIPASIVIYNTTSSNILIFLRIFFSLYAALNIETYSI
jgi:hypothetical protein